MLLAGPISHTSTQYIDFVDFFFFTFQWICLPIILLILVGVELPLHVVVTILECCVTFSGVKLSIRSFVLFINVLLCSISLRRINFADKTMADRVSRKHMGKRFRLSSEVRATLQRKHDRWTPYCAYSRVEKEVGVFRAICQIILSFFKMPPKTDEGEVGCNGRAVKMFADLIKRSFRDDDFVSRKCTTFNVVLFFFYYRIIRFLLMV